MEGLEIKAINALDDINKTKEVGFYNVAFLDDFLHGIYQDDLTIITAQTGAGKTEIAFNIAYKNAINKKVLLFALEANEFEPDKRFLYRIIYNLYQQDKDKKYQNFCYRNFIHNKLDIAKYREQAIAIYSSENKPDIVYYNNEFTLDTLKQKFLSSGKEYDLIVLDHLDYFDVMNDLSESQQMSNIMKELRNINTEFKKPIIAVSHLRKGARKTLMPTIDDLMGSSNKAKIATTVITLAPDKENYCNDGMYPTFFTIQKSRAGTTGNLLIKHVFNSYKNDYEKDYQLYNYNSYEDKAEILDKSKYPKWFKSGDSVPF